MKCKNTHTAYINTYFPSIWEINSSLNLGSVLPHTVPQGLDCSFKDWGRHWDRGVHLHTSLMARLLQITHDTSSDDIFQPPSCWMASLHPLPLPSIHQHPTPTHTLIPAFIRVTIAQQRLLPPAFTWLTPLSRCWIWSNHSQSSLNISFFKQNRGSKFHHSMTRSVADNTIKPIPAYPEGAISRGTAGRWDYRPTERCQSHLIQSSLCATYTAEHLNVEGDHRIGISKDQQ